MTLEVFQKPTLSDYLMICDRLPLDEREQFEAFNGMPYDRDKLAVMLNVKSGPAWVMCADGAPISAAGFDYIRPGVWQDWQVNTPEAYGRHWRTLIKEVKRAMDAMLDQTDTHRLQCVSLATRVNAHRMYAVFGLAPEGTLKGYGANGEDAIMFARVKHGQSQFSTRRGTTGRAGTSSPDRADDRTD